MLKVQINYINDSIIVSRFFKKKMVTPIFARRNDKFFIRPMGGYFICLSNKMYFKLEKNIESSRKKLK